MTPMITRPVSALAAGVPLARYIRGLRFGDAYASTHFRDTPQVEHALTTLRTKAAIGGMESVDAPDLTSLGIYDPQTAMLLAGQSAFEAARSRMRELPFGVPVPRQTDAGTGGGWVTEGAALPVVSYGFDRITFKPVLCGSVIVVSEELLRDSRVDLILRDSLLGAMGRTESRLFLDPSIGPTGSTPASITYDVAPVAASDSMGNDLSAMFGMITTSGRGLAWVMRGPDLAMVAAALGASAPDLPRTLLGVPVILAPNAPAHQVTLVDLAEVAYAASALAVELSDEATVEMSGEPVMATATGSPLAPNATSAVSLFQTNSVAYKVSRYLNWVARDGSVSYLVLNTGSPA